MTPEPRAQVLPVPPLCEDHKPPVQMRVVPYMLTGQGRPRLVFDVECPECGALRKGFA